MARENATEHLPVVGRWDRFLHRVRFWLESKAHLLKYFFWEATLRCPLSCGHCGSDCMKESDIPDLAADKVRRVFQDIANAYDPRGIMVAITGGEAFAREDLFEVTQFIAKLGFPWGAVTNGWLVTPDLVRICVQTGMKTVSVSIDGMEESHNSLRRHPESFARAWNALDLFSREQLLAEAITCVHAGNIHDLPKLREALVAAKIRKWRLVSIFPKGRAKLRSSLVVNASVLHAMLEFIEQTRREFPQLNASYTEEGYLGPRWEGVVRDADHRCRAGINIGGLLASGAFAACPSLSSDWNQGHADGASFPEVWEKRYQRFRNRRWMKNSFCGDCKDWGNCQGNSLHLWDWSNHRPHVCHLRLLASPGGHHTQFKSLI